MVSFFIVHFPFVCAGAYVAHARLAFGRMWVLAVGVLSLNPAISAVDDHLLYPVLSCELPCDLLGFAFCVVDVACPVFTFSLDLPGSTVAVRYHRIHFSVAHIALR